MDQDELEQTPEAAPEPGVEGEAAPVEASAAPAEATAAPVDADGGAAADADGTPVRPREHIRGIHPELLCSCQECEPDYVELQWFSVDEARKVKGTAMLYCGYSGRKYFSPVPDLQAFLTANPVRGRKSAQ